MGFETFFAVFSWDDKTETDWKDADARLHEMMEKVAAEYRVEKKAIRWMIWDDDIKEQPSDWNSDMVDFEGDEIREKITDDWRHGRKTEMAPKRPRGRGNFSAQTISLDSSP